MDNQKTGMLIRELRKERGWKLVDLAEKLNVSFSSISRIENGSQEVTYTLLRKICEQFDLSLSQFFKMLENTVGIDAIDIEIKEVDVESEIQLLVKELSVEQQKALYLLLKK